MSYTKQTDLSIWETTEYDKFSFFDENREVSNNHVLERNILENNRLHLNPIIITTDFKIVDGQHRFLIAKKNGLPIFYIIEEDIGVRDICYLNLGRDNWTRFDYITFYAKLGFPNYIKLESILKKYTMNYKSIMQFVASSQNRYVDERIKNGKFEMKKDIEYIFQILDLAQEVYDDIKNVLNFRKLSVALQVEIIRLCAHPEFDLARMKKQIVLYPTALMRANSHNKKRYVQQCFINETYNKKYHASNRIEIIEEDSEDIG